MSPILQIENVHLTFGGLHALRGVSYEVPTGAVVGLIGPNGAGKTTLFNCITGFLTPDSGRILFRGAAIQARPPHEIARLGLARTFQITRPFKELSCEQNVLVAIGFRQARGIGALRRYASREAQAEARALLDRVGLGEQRATPVMHLPLGFQRRLEVARSLALHPRLLLLDEPMAGLSAAEIDELAALIRDLRDQGNTLLLVEHNMDVAMSLASQIVVLHYGQVIATGPPERVAKDPAVIEAYLGEELDGAS